MRIDAFSETEHEARFELVVDGLRVERRLVKAFRKCPENAVVLNEIFQEQSLNFAFEFRKSSQNPTTPNSRRYRLHIKRLPTRIYPERTKIKVNFSHS